MTTQLKIHLALLICCSFLSNMKNFRFEAASLSCRVVDLSLYIICIYCTLNMHSFI
jgi:hypothetical protein